MEFVSQQGRYSVFRIFRSMLELEYIFGLGKVYSHRFIESEICLQLFEYEIQTEHRKRTPVSL